MLNGYVILYTGWAGLQQYSSTGSCQAKLVSNETWCCQIVVPRESTNIEWDGGEKGIPDIVKVDLKKR
ncbi:hypothetical protein [Peribacillus sp. JNUCC41]|uniref:hypothetical protein n=1 Tax=Peribacillus sp. JNUCC41 TaxID=2778370 RepID=UPI001780D006|nr:hypothetical protein [Brevibacillus sp. JNUCC-41]QOS89238.1 hypothetical protein JNUCC41_21125 [Brevibacillus sp. JNUCC-41]